jgi:hypothetical protein
MACGTLQFRLVAVVVGTMIILPARKPTASDAEDSDTKIEYTSKVSRAADQGAFDSLGITGVAVFSDLKFTALECLDIGPLVVTSGWIGASDGMMVGLSDLQFDVKVAPGEYPVRMALADIEHPNGTKDRRFAFASVILGEGKVVSWRPAKLLGGDLFQGSEPAYGVDSGCGSYFDLDFAREYESELPKEMYAKIPIIEEMSKTSLGSADWATATGTAGSLVVFSSGFGDGSCICYFGYDANENVIAILTDLGVLKSSLPRRTGSP